MIVVRVVGGLGNQMFQYAHGRALSLRHRVPLRLDVSGYATYKVHAYALDKLRIEATPIGDGELSRMRPRGLIGRLLSRTPAVKRVREKSFTYDPDVAEMKPPLYLDGYWQSQKYFAAYAGVLRGELGLREPLAGRSAEIAREMTDSESAAVHVRRGDYVNNPNANAVHGTCDAAYYHAAVQQLARRVALSSLFVFSDDLAWARTHLRFDYPATFVDVHGADEGHKDMHLMAACRHQIIANSSFSWWAAWLNVNPAKIVIAPRRWFRSNEMNTRDLLPEGWVRLQSGSTTT